MTDPTHDKRSTDLPWRLTLEHGDRLEIHPPAEGSDEPKIVLTLQPYRADELGTVLDRYNRLAAIFAESSDVWTEDSLARGLRDAPAAITSRANNPVVPSRVGAAERGRAMVILQRARPELTHDQLVAVIDAAASWLDTGADYKATDLLDALAATDVSGQIYSTLLAWRTPTEAAGGDDAPAV